MTIFISGPKKNGGPRPPRPVLPEELRRQKQNEVDECLKQVKEAMDNENYLKALANLHKAFDLCSKHGLAPTYDMHIIRSKINFEAGEYEYAAEYVQDAISLDENNPSGYILKASIQRERKQWELGPLLSALQRFPRNIEILLLLSEIEYEKGEYGMSKIHYNAAKSIDTSIPRPEWINKIDPVEEEMNL